MKFQGKAVKYGDNVDTDVIIPARYLNISDKHELALHAMEDIDPDFTKRSAPATFLWRAKTSAAAPAASTPPLCLRKAA